MGPAGQTYPAKPCVCVKLWDSTGKAGGLPWMVIRVILSFSTRYLPSFVRWRCCGDLVNHNLMGYELIRELKSLIKLRTVRIK